jgi:hypothetical protein
MLLKRSRLTLLMQSLIVVLCTTMGTLALAKEPMMSSDESEPCPLNSETASPNAEPDALCSTMPADLLRAAAEWSKPAAALSLKALDHAEGDADISVGSKVKVHLSPSQNVSLLINPGKTARVINFAGLVSFRSGKAGPYRILLSQYMWLETIDASGKPAIVLDSNRRLDTCSGMGRNVSFDLAANTRYWLQMSGAKKGDEVELVISAPQ